MKITAVTIFLAALIISCAPKTNSVDMNLNEVMNYNWDTSKEEIPKDFFLSLLTARAYGQTIVRLPTHTEIITQIENLGARNVYINNYVESYSNQRHIIEVDSRLPPNNDMLILNLQLLSGSEGDAPANTYIDLGVNYEGAVTVGEVRKALAGLFTKAGFTNESIVNGKAFDIGRNIPVPAVSEIIAKLERLGARKVHISAGYSSGHIRVVTDYRVTDYGGNAPSNCQIRMSLTYEGKVSVTRVRKALSGLFAAAGFTHWSVIDGSAFIINGDQGSLR